MSKDLGDFTVGDWFKIFLKAWPAFLLVAFVTGAVMALGGGLAGILYEYYNVQKALDEAGLASEDESLPPEFYERLLAAPPGAKERAAAAAQNRGE